jgi:hypothetical protein
VPELAVTVGRDPRDNPAWATDCTGGPGGRNVVLTVNRRTGRLSTNLWRCKRNHLGCRKWRWEGQKRGPERVVDRDALLFVSLAPGGEWETYDHRREYLERRTGVKVQYAWVLHSHGVRFVVADADLTPWKSAWPMRPVTRDEALRVLGWHHVRASAVQRQMSKGWKVRKESSVIVRGRGDRVTKARIRAGLDGLWLPAPVMEDEVEEARRRLEAELEAVGDEQWVLDCG